MVTVFTLISAFLNFKIGLSFEDVSKLVNSNEIFVWNNVEVEFVNPESDYFKADGTDYLKYANFTFKDKKLASYSFVLDKIKIDRYAIYLELKNKFDEADFISQRKYIWSNLEGFTLIFEDNILRITKK